MSRFAPQIIYHLTQFIFMKRIILGLAFFITLFTCFSSFAQLEQGTFVVNERFDFSTFTTKSNDGIFEDGKDVRYSSTTSLGYLIKENQEVGISVLFGSQKISSADNTTGSGREYGFGIYYKRYVTIVDKLSFFVSPQLEYSIRRPNKEFNEFGTNGIGANIYTGILYRPTPKFGLSMNLVGAGINYTTYKSPSVKQNSFSLSNVGGLNLALQFMF